MGLTDRSCRRLIFAVRTAVLAGLLKVTEKVLPVPACMVKSEALGPLRVLSGVVGEQV